MKTLFKFLLVLALGAFLGYVFFNEINTKLETLSNIERLPEVKTVPEPEVKTVPEPEVKTVPEVNKPDINYQGTCQGTWANFEYQSEHITTFYLNSGSVEGRKSLDTLRINNYIDNFYDKSVSRLRLSIYSFVDADHNLYMISYDTTITTTGYDKYDDITKSKTVVESWRDGFSFDLIFEHSLDIYTSKRNLYLWRWSDNKWEIASNVIQTDTWTSEVRETSSDKTLGRKQSADTYFPRQEGANLKYLGDEGDTYVKEFDNGEVEIKMICNIIGNGFIQEWSRMYYKILRFTPNGDGTYKSTLISTNK